MNMYSDKPTISPFSRQSKKFAALNDLNAHERSKQTQTKHEQARKAWGANPKSRVAGEWRHKRMH